MNKFLCISYIFLMLVPIVSPAQTFRYAIQPGFNSTEGRMQILPDNTVRVFGIASNDWWFGTAALSMTRFDLQGNRIDERVYSSVSHEDGMALGILPLRDGSAIVAAALGGCDYDYPVSLVRIDVQGNVSWLTLEEEITYTEYLILQMATDSMFYLDGWAGEAFYTFSGIRVDPPSGWVLYDQLMLNSEGHLARHENQIHRLDEEISILQSATFTSPVLAIDTLANDRCIVATTDSMFILGADFSAHIRSVEVDEGIPDRVFGTRSHYWFADFTANAFYRYDTLLSTYDKYLIPKDLRIADVAVLGDTILISGFRESQNASMFLIQTSAIHFSGTLPNDIGVMGIRLTDTARYEDVDWGWGSGYPVRDVYYGPTYVTLENFGSDTIHQAEVRFEQNACPSFCQGVLQYAWDLNDLNLPPGESREYFLDILDFKCTFYDIHTLCLYAMNPNSEPDAVAENDRHCIAVDVVSDIEDVGLWEHIMIYPNPASESIFIEVPDESAHASDIRVVLLNTDGRSVLAQNCDRSMNEIRVDGLSRGIYLVWITSETRMVGCRRIVLY